MATKLDIINMALSLINQKNISDVDERSIPAEKAKLFYDEVLRRLIETYDWSFCSESRLFTGIPMDRNLQYGYYNTYLYEYKLPENDLKFGEDIRISGSDRNCPSLNARNQNMRKPYIIEGKNLYSDEPMLFLKVIIFQKDESFYSSSFTWALIYSLAAELTKVLIDSASYSQLMTVKAKEAELEAIAEDQRKFPTEFARH